MYINTAQSKAPNVGEEGFIQEPHTLSVVLKCLPKEVRGAGSRRHCVVHTCFDVAEQYLAVGSEQGYVWILDLHATKLIRELNVSSLTIHTAFIHVYALQNRAHLWQYSVHYSALKNRWPM